jgi:uncharacterized membrane protein YfcA
MHGPVTEAIQFIDLNLSYAIFLVIVGFIGGLVSGFIGSGGAFVLTPGMMSLGVPGTVAVASNMCHKFPKALVGSIKRYPSRRPGAGREGRTRCASRRSCTPCCS